MTTLRILLILCLLGAATVVTAQDGQSQCPAIVNQALDVIGDNCNGTDTNNACYANFLVDATFKADAGSTQFDEPGDRASLESFATIRTTNDVEDGEWGIAVLSLRLDAPLQGTLPGENVKFLMIGDVEIEDAGDSDTDSPMQAFYFRQLNLGAPQCAEAPSVLAIRSPEDTVVNLIGNGANIEIASTVLLQIAPPGNTMKLLTIDGEAVLEPNTPLETTVPAGNSALRCLSAPDDLGVDGLNNDQRVVDSCAWTQPVPLNAEEQALADTVNDIFDRLDLEDASDDCPAGRSDIEHRVGVGENVFRIARKYDTTIEAIVTENNLSSAQVIVVGQVLQLSCVVDTGLSPVAPLRPILPPTTFTGP